MFIYPCIIFTVLTIIGWFTLIKLHSRADLISTTIQSLIPIGYWFVWALGKRFKEKMVYFIAINYLFQIVMVGMTSEAMKLVETDIG